MRRWQRLGERVLVCVLLLVSLRGFVLADWQWERSLPALSSWLLGANGEVYVYAYYSQPPQQSQSRQQLWCINSDGTERWRLSGRFQDGQWPIFYPLSDDPRYGYGLVAPALALDRRTDRLHVLLGAYKPAYDLCSTPVEIAYAQVERVNSGNAELRLVRTIQPHFASYIHAYGLYYTANHDVYILYTGVPFTWLEGIISDNSACCPQNQACFFSFVPQSQGCNNTIWCSTDWFGGLICNSTAPNRTRWDGRFIGKSLKLLNRLGSGYDQLSLSCLPPMGAADVDSAGNTVMMFFASPSMVISNRVYGKVPPSFNDKDRVLVFIDNSGEVRWLRQVRQLGRLGGSLASPMPEDVYRVWMRIGSSYVFTAELIRYPNDHSRTAVVNCYSKSSGVQVLSQKWGTKDLFGIVVVGDRCYVGLVRDLCEGCSSTQCTEVWEVTASGARRVACHSGRGLAIAYADGYIAVLLDQSCGTTPGIKVQLWDTSGVPYWSTTKCLSVATSLPIGVGELQMRWSVDANTSRRRLDIGARVAFFATSSNFDQRAVLVKGQWTFQGDW